MPDLGQEHAVHLGGVLVLLVLLGLVEPLCLPLFSRPRPSEVCWTAAEAQGWREADD